MENTDAATEYYTEPENNKITPRTLYLVATPIGNLSDISYRAVKVLSEVDFIAAEDTRNTPKLLSRYGIKKPLVSYFEHNKAQRGEQIVQRLQNGESCALVTDAGTPAISDPGEDLVRLCREKGIAVTSIPGACAAITALTLSSISSRRFVFEGFLPAEKAERRQKLAELSNEPRTVVLYEAPHRLKSALKELHEALGDRELAVVRELTKINEQTLNTTLSGAAAYYEQNEPRGEFVLVIAGVKAAEGGDFWENMTITEHVAFYEAQGMGRMDAIKAAAKDRRIPKSSVYSEIAKEKSEL